VVWPFKRQERVEPHNAVPTDPFSVSFLRALGIGGGVPEVVTPASAMSVSAVFRAVSLVSGTLATLPLRTLQPGRDGMQKRVASFLDSPGLDVHTPFEWKEFATVCLLLHGNAYAQHVYNRNGALAGLNLLQPTAVKVDAAPDRPGGRLFTVTLDGGDKIELDATQLTHIMGVSLDGIQGVSLLTLARLGFTAAQAGERAAHQMFTSGAMVAGLVTPEDEDLDEDEAKVVKETVNAAMTGPSNAGAIAVINRRLKFQPWMLSAADAQFLQSRTFNVEEIGRWFGVPPHLLGQTEKSTSWGTGIEEQNRGPGPLHARAVDDPDRAAPVAADPRPAEGRVRLRAAARAVARGRDPAPARAAQRRPDDAERGSPDAEPAPGRRRRQAAPARRGRGGPERAAPAARSCGPAHRPAPLRTVSELTHAKAAA
jgi:HK97 family phage portal protein